MNDKENTSLDEIFGDVDTSEVETAEAVETVVNEPVEAVGDNPAEETKPETTQAETEKAAIEGEQPAPAEPEPEPVNTGTMPYGAYAAEKDKRQGLEKSLAEIQAENDRFKAEKAAWEYQRKQNQPEPVALDPLDEGYTDKLLMQGQEQIMGAINPLVQNLQRQVAELKHTPEVLGAAEKWFDTLQPNEQQAIWAKHGTDYAGLISEHKAHALRTEIGDDPEAYKERLKAEWLAEMNGGNPALANPAPTTQTQSKTEFAPSIAGAQSVGERNPKWSGPKSLDEIFPD